MEKVTTINFEGSEGVEITPIKQRRNWVPKYFNIGIKYQNLIICGLKGPARKMLAALIENRDILTNRAVYAVSGTTDKCSTTKAYRELKKHKIVIRTSKQHYFINPSVILPMHNRYPELKIQWMQEIE